ncbi:MAG: hypothetical protein GY940_02395 [bacterium]|nr:hypothetical protein [bacterium]
MSDVFQQLKSSDFGEYFAALKEIRGDTNHFAAIDEEKIKYICRAFELYRYGYEDILAIKKKALQVLNRHMSNDRIKDKSLLRGIKRYASGYLRHEYDSSGFIYVAGSIKIAAKIDLDKILEILETDAPDDAEMLHQYKKFLRHMESSSHQAYHILREVGNKFTDYLGSIIHQLTPTSQDTILHALENFPRNKTVITFYEDYMEKAAFEWLKDEAEDYLYNIKSS